jgi:hypothetical protein
MSAALTDFNDLAQAAGPEAIRDAIEGAQPAHPLSKLVVVDAAALMVAVFPPREVLLAPWLLSQSLSMIYAWRGVGKTYLAMLIAYALASGGKCLNWTAERPVRVLYIDGEMSGAELRDRLAGIIASSEAEPPPDFLRFITPDLQPGGIVPDLATPQGQRDFEAHLGEAQVIIVDNLSCLARTGKENEGDSWQPVAEWALRMRASGRSVIFIHHSGKGGQQRGTSRREDLLNVVISLRHPSDYGETEGARFEVHFEKRRGLHGDDIAPIEAALETFPDGRQEWAIRKVEESNADRMIELAQLGLSDADIARELGVHRSSVMRGLRKAEETGKLARHKQGRGRGRDGR